MDTLHLYTRGAHALASILSLLLARRRVEHRPVAAFILGTFLADSARWALNAGPLDAPRPYTGALRALFHLDQALLLTWPFGLMALAWVVFLRRRPTSPLVAYIVALGAIALAYPRLRMAPLAWTYAGVYLAAVIAALVCAGIWTARRADPRPEHAATSLIALLDLALFAGPFSPPAPQPFDRWTIAQAIYLVTWGAILLIQAAALWGGFLLSPSPRSSSSRLH